MRCRLFRPYVAAGFAAVAAAGAVGGGGSSASASLAKVPARVVAVPVAAAASPGAAGARLSTLLSTGERVLTGPATAVIGAAGARRTGSVVQLSFVGTQYASPSGAVSYLGHGLHMSLSGVTGVAGRKRGGALLARVTYSARVPGPPGMRITRAPGGVVSGYLTGATPPPVLRKAAPKYTLTVHGINAAGQPDNGDFVVVANVDNPKAFGESERALGTFKNGTATFKVPAGTYWAVGAYNSGVAWGGPDRSRHGGAQMIVLPQFAVSADKTVTVDARKATSRLRLSTPLPAIPENEQINVERISSGGQKFEVSVTAGNLAGGFYVNSVSHEPADGTLDCIIGAQLFSPASAARLYQYYVIVKSPSGTIPPHRFRISGGSLATVHENLYAGAPSTGSFTTLGYLPGELGYPLNYFSLPTLRVPGRDTLYLSAVGGSAVWQGRYDQVLRPPAGGQHGTAVRYRPGQTATVDWNTYPLHTAPNVNLLGAVNGNMIVSANRSGDKLTLDFMPFSDSVYGHLGTGYFLPPSNGTVSGSYQIRQNGTTIASGNALNSPGIPTGEFYHQVTLSPKPSVVSFTLTAKRTGAAFTLSTATATTWTWRSGHESGATVPSWWYCSLASNHDCATQPLPMLSYAVRGVALNGTAAPGTQSLTVMVGHLQLAAAQTVTKVTVQASFNDGKSWTSAAVTGAAGTYHAHYTAPASHYVTLRVTAATTIGSQVSETITRAYATAP